MDKRRLPSGKLVDRLQNILVEGLRLCETGYPRAEPFAEGSTKQELLHLACGRRLRSPFPAAVLARTRDDMRLALLDHGFDSGLGRAGDRHQKFEVRLIEVLAIALKDPDAVFCRWWARGVWIGEPGRKLPRTPAVFERKTKWALKPLDGSEGTEWRPNYTSAADHLQQVKTQFEKEVGKGFMEVMTLDQAIARFGERLTIAAIGAIEKKGSDDVRVIYDGSHGVLTNYGIRVRDLVRNPTASDLKAWLGEQAREGGPHFCLVYDVSDAHRQVPVDERDWGLQACQLSGTAAETARLYMEGTRPRATLVPGPGAQGDAPRPRQARAPPRSAFSPAQLKEEVWVNTVGTFGVSSAGYWWGRAGALVVRLTHYLTPMLLALWLLLYADDGMASGRGARYDRAILFHLFVLEVLGTPFKWQKVRGGIQVDWIGYWIDIGRFEIGISQSRADWCVKWLTDKSRERRVRLGELREGLGRLVFVAGPLEHLRPLLGPLFAWASQGRNRHARPLLPAMLLLILDFIASQLQSCRAIGCREPAKDAGEIFRLDAKAAGNDVAIGGWLSAGGVSTKEAPWFAVALTKANAPWAFHRGEPFRVVASLELLGALVSVMTLLPEADWARPADSSGIVTIGCATDNQGNSFLMDKLLTTKFPLGLILIELSYQLARRRMALRAEWVPRLQNEEADALTNGEYHAFDPDRRVEVRLEDLNFGVLNELLATGESYVEEVEKAKAEARADRAQGQSRAPAMKARKKGSGLRETQPW